jgi:hypothetical protein
LPWRKREACSGGRRCSIKVHCERGYGERARVLHRYREVSPSEADPGYLERVLNLVVVHESSDVDVDACADGDGYDDEDDGGDHLRDTALGPLSPYLIDLLYGQHEPRSVKNL